MTQGAGPSGGFGIFAQLTRALRHAPGRESLHFSIVNETRRLLPYRRAALLLADRQGRLRVAALSGVPVVERHAPLVRWLEDAAAAVLAGQQGAPDRVRPIAAESLAAPRLQEGRQDLAVGLPLWCPLVAPSGTPLGALWLERPEPWREADILLLAELADAQAHALAALDGPRRRRFWHRHGWRGWTWRLGLAAAALLAMLLPVPRAALAPVEITAADPEVVAAPIDGVVRSIQVQPNQRVSVGEPLFRLDDTDRRARLDVAARALDVAEEAYRQASQGALGGLRDAPRLAGLKAEIDLRRVEMAAAASQLARTEVRAGRAGIVILPDPQGWIGRPVQTGERVMEIADPAEVRARAWLAPRDILPLEPGMPARLFLDVDPLAPVDARLLRAGHEPEQVPGGEMAYRLTLALDLGPGQPPPRIGLRGTARIEGDEVPLYLYLFRRPIAVLRQAVGF